MIRIAILDDHPIVRQGLVSALDGEPDISVVGTAGSAQALLEKAADWKPDVVVFDLEMPGLSGADAVREVMRALPRARVLVFTAYADDDKIVSATRAGAAGYLLKGSPASELAGAIREVDAGRSYFSSSIASALARQVRDPQRSALTSRELEILRLIADGLSNKQIARRIGITERTVKYHANSVISKLGAENRAQAVATALRRNIL